MPFNFGDIPLILQELRRYFASKAQGTLADSALQPGAIGSTVQAYHARLDSLSGITNADGGIEKTGANTYGRYALTAFGKSLVDDADASTARSTLGLTIGSNVQAWDADLDAIAAISTNGPIERTGPGTWAVSDRIRLFGGNGRGTNFDFTTTGNITLDEGVYYFRNFTVASGHTVTVSKFARIYCSGTVTINGLITVTTAAPGGVAQPTLSFSIAQGGESGFGLGGQQSAGAATLYGAAGTPYPYTAQPFGSGGTAGYGSIGSGTADIRYGNGGNGGGGLIIEAVGAISILKNSETPSITADGSNATEGQIFSATGNAAASGGGGGSGGVIVLSSLASITLDKGTATSTTVLRVSGGNGGNAAITGAGVAGGSGGGGGGWLMLTAPTLNYLNSASIGVSGGTGGVGAGTGGSPGGGFGAACAGAGGINTSAPTAGASGSAGRLIQRTWREVA